MTFDWQSIHARLKKNQNLMEQGSHPDAATSKAILKSRAEALAREPERMDGQFNHVSLMAFELSDERYAFELKHVQEIFPLKGLTPLPCTPPFILGIINLRGQIITLIDIRQLLALPEKKPDHFSRVILLGSNTTVIGILVDKVIGTTSIDMNTLQSSLSGFSELSEEYLKGISSDQMVILDALKIVTDKKIVVDEQV